VFFNKLATVSLPTQPGTGVMRFQFSLISSNSASQYIFRSMIVNHTSITIVLSLIFSSFNNQGTQAAHMTISAVFVNLLISGVFELQLITVVQAFISITTSGLPTILLFQITTTSFHCNSIFQSSNISITQ